MKAKAKFTRLMPMSVWVEFIVFNFQIVSWLLLDHMYCYQKYCIAIRNKCFSKPVYDIPKPVYYIPNQF